MIDVKQAVAAAKQAANELLDEAQLNELQLEEVEYNDQSSTWLITLGFTTKSISQISAISAVIAGTNQFTRKYKTFYIDGETGSVKSMKIRTV